MSLEESRRWAGPLSSAGPGLSASVVAASGLTSTEARTRAPGRAGAGTQGVPPAGDSSAGPGRVGSGPRCRVRPQAVVEPVRGSTPASSAGRSSPGSRGPPGPHEGVEGSGRHQGVQLTPGAPPGAVPMASVPLASAENGGRPRTRALSAARRLSPVPTEQAPTSAHGTGQAEAPSWGGRHSRKKARPGGAGEAAERAGAVVALRRPALATWQGWRGSGGSGPRAL